MLTLIGEVKSTDWNTVMEIVGCPTANIKGYFDKIEILDKKWYDNYRLQNSEYYPLNLSDLKTWSTYSHTCIDLIFTMAKDKLHCHAKIYDGNSFDGRRTKLRFTANLILPNNFINVLEDDILSSFDYYLEDQYDIYLETQKINWMTDFKNKFLENE